jgi:hypothetical protein
LGISISFSTEVASVFQTGLMGILVPFLSINRFVLNVKAPSFSLSLENGITNDAIKPVSGNCSN